MSFNELVSSDMRTDLVTEIQNMSFNGCSNEELTALSSWATGVRRHADFLTLEDELVGHIYDNLCALTPKIASEESKRGISLVKTMKFNK